MKKMNKYISVALIAVTAGLATGCSDEFLQDKNCMAVSTGQLFMRITCLRITVLGICMLVCFPMRLEVPTR